jgi:heterodisulfide reductase subunit B
MKYVYFSGCVIPQRENAYELSARRVLEKFEIELIELKGANCCGFFLDAIDHLSSSVLAARDLCLAEEIGCEMLTLCPTCSGHLTRVKTELSKDPDFRSSINAVLGKINKKFEGSSGVKHITRVLLEDVGIEKIRSTIVKPLEHLKVAPHYGCHIMKPSDEIGFDSPENPKLLDSLIEATGVRCVNYLEKRQCCGAPTMGVDVRLSLAILRKKLKSIKDVGVDAIVTICPFCHTHFDLNQARVNEDYGENYKTPVLHYTQLLGLAQGYEPDDLGLYENRVSVDDLLDLIRREER